MYHVVFVIDLPEHNIYIYISFRIHRPGFVRLHITGAQRSPRVSILLSHRRTRFVAQFGAHRVHSSFPLGHGDYVFAKRGGPLVGRQRFGHATGTGKYNVCGNVHIRRDGLQGAVADVTCEYICIYIYICFCGELNKV